jgi:outer membrane protein W
MIVLILISIYTAKAQTKDFKHFEVGLSALFWSPSSLHLKSSSNSTRIQPPVGDAYSVGSMSGYGSGVAPMLSAKYYFNENIGIAFSFQMLHLLNELTVNTTDTSFVEYSNEAIIPYFNLGLTGRYNISNSIKPFYEVGITFSPAYNFELRYHTNIYNREDFDADGVAIGLYIASGINIKLSKSLSFNTAAYYSFIPTTLEYTQTSDGVSMTEETNIGGFGIQTGLIFNF